MLAGGDAQTGLNAAGGSMTLNEQGQHLAFKRQAERGSEWRGEKGLGQRLGGALSAGVECLTRDAKLLAEGGDRAIVASMGNHVANGLEALCRADMMSLNHSVPLKGW